MPAISLSVPQGAQLLHIARAALEYGLDCGKILQISLDEYDSELSAMGASFVSLHRQGELRGCMGKLSPLLPLAQDVAENAYNAAFRDPRFPPLSKQELTGLEVEISVLGPKEALDVANEDELIGLLRPGRDGLVLEMGQHRGTFLPVVWQYYPEPREFVRKLKSKAGLPEGFWSEAMRCWRYETELIDEKNG